MCVKRHSMTSSSHRVLLPTRISVLQLGMGTFLDHACKHSISYDTVENIKYIKYTIYRTYV